MIKNDIIVAIATPPGIGAVGIVRLSGSGLAKFIETLLPERALKPRRATLVTLADAKGEIIDQALALYFSGPHSYTGEDVLELQTHGGEIVLRMVLTRCQELGARLAEPGEFTRRAYQNGKLDLAQAESVIDLINATTSQAARSAQRSLSGEFSQKIQFIEKKLIETRVLIEAMLDFPEEETAFLENAGITGKLSAVELELLGLLDASRQGNFLRDGISVVIMGRPNAGKSSLMNRLVGEDVAIVTEIPGTTRDVITQAIHIEGVPLHIVDTAGLRETTDPVEKIGIARTWTTATASDIALILVDATTGFTVEDAAIIESLPEGVTPMVVFNKVDLMTPVIHGVSRETSVTQISAKTGLGIGALKLAILKVVGWRPSGEGVFLARNRHLEALQLAQVSIERAKAYQQGAAQLEFLAEELRLAQQALGTITGEFTTNDLLGEIFSRFCLGK